MNNNHFDHPDRKLMLKALLIALIFFSLGLLLGESGALPLFSKIGLVKVKQAAPEVAEKAVPKGVVKEAVKEAPATEEEGNRLDELVVKEADKAKTIEPFDFNEVDIPPAPESLVLKLGQGSCSRFVEYFDTLSDKEKIAFESKKTRDEVLFIMDCLARQKAGEFEAELPPSPPERPDQEPEPEVHPDDIIEEEA